MLENQSIPEVTLAILNLQEFMEHWGKGTLDIRYTRLQVGQGILDIS